MTSPLFWTWDLSLNRNQLFSEKILHVNELQVKKVSLYVPDFFKKIVLSRTWKKVLAISKILCTSKKYLVSICVQISQELQWNFEAKISLHDVTKSINSQANNKSPMVQQQSYKYFSIELSTILLNVYHSLEKLGTMGAISRT